MNSLFAPSVNRYARIRQLIARRLLQFYRDKTDLKITFLQAPILALGFYFIFQGVVTAGGATQFQPLREYLGGSVVSVILFLAVLTAIWFGVSKAIAEIPANQVLYQQERLSFLKDFDYLISIFISLSLICLGQVILFGSAFYLLFVILPAIFEPYQTGIVLQHLQFEWPWNWVSYNDEEKLISKKVIGSISDILMPMLLLQFILLLWLTSVAAIALAMLVSVFIKSRSAAVAIMPFVLIAQILMAGSIIQPVLNMQPAVRYVADLMVSRWSLEASILLFDRYLIQDKQRYQEDSDFSSFSFTGKGEQIKMRRIDVYPYLKGLNDYIQKSEANLTTILNNKIYAYFWFKAVAGVKISKNKDKQMRLNEEELNYLKQAKKLNNNLDYELDENRQLGKPQSKFLNTPIPSDKVKKLIFYKFINTKGDSLKSYAHEILQKKIDKQTALTELEQKIWQHMQQFDPLLLLYRSDNYSKTWLNLLVLTLAMWLLSWFSFTRLNRLKIK